MHGSDPRGKLAATSVGRCSIVERRGEPRLGDLAAPRQYRCVRYFPLLRERFEFVEHVGAIGRDGVWICGKASEPNPVAPQDMVERAVNRPEERAAIALALDVVQLAGERVQTLVQPVAVARLQLTVRRRDHNADSGASGAGI